MKSFLSNYWLKIVAYFSVVITPISTALVSLGILVFCDLITGIIKAKKTGEPITSRAMSKTATKLLLYFMLIICGEIVETQFLTLDFLPAKLTQLLAGFVAVIEFKSMAENISVILGIPIWQYIKTKLTR